MKEIRSRSHKNKINTHSISLPKLGATFSEQDILHVHKVFLMPGLHYFHVLNIQAGRLFVYQFLSSLHCYKNIGCLAATSEVAKDIRDVLEELQEHGFLHEPYFLDEFFIENFDYDFMWIETTVQMCTLPWYLEFYNKMQEYNISAHIPIIILSYEQEQ